MAAIASIGSTVIISMMAAVAINRYMSALKHIIVAVDREGCRMPVRICCMTCSACGRDTDCSMIWISCLVVVSLMTAYTGIGSIVIVPVVATVTADGGMCSCQRIICIMYDECGRRPSRIGSMTIGTGRGNPCSGMVWICCLVIIILMTGNAGIRSI